MKMSLPVIFQRKWKSELFKSSLDNLSTFTHYSKRSENVVTFQRSLFLQIVKAISKRLKRINELVIGGAVFHCEHRLKKIKQGLPFLFFRRK